MKIVFFSFYYPPDLSAGSFRSIALAKSLSAKLDKKNEIHVLTTYPNRYKSHISKAKNKEIDELVTVHRIKVPSHSGNMLSQCYTFLVYAIISFNLCRKIKPDFIIGTSSRLMTAYLAALSAKYLKKRYFIDLRDIFSETISDIFYQKSRLIGAIFKYFFIKLEQYTLNSAALVNVVSEGFFEYFDNNGINTKDWKFFPNGVDAEFENLFLKNINNTKGKVKITYAGNIGDGQGLEKIIPKLGLELGLNYEIIVIGDGGAIDKLKSSVLNQNISNVKLIPPIDRQELVNYYLESDILFLHLNNLSAFRRVLPSKIFEYGAIGKPILAGLKGYPADFVRINVPYASIFEPGDSQAAIKYISKINKNSVLKKDVDKFIDNFSRKKIMDDLTDELILVIQKEL
jgi:glycosyltransferase involved in cell wall biosynthesis